MRCLNTDLLVAILRGKEEARKKLVQLDEEGRAGTTSINTFEIFYGANESARKIENINEASKLLERLVVFPLNISSSKKAAQISVDLTAKGEIVDFRNAMIAAISINNDLKLVTRNYAHFKRIKDLKIELW